MLTRHLRSTVVTASLCAAIACSPSHAETSAGSGAGVAPVTGSTGAAATAPIDCRKVFAPGDAAGLLTPPVDVSAIGEGTGWCGLTSGTGRMITVRTGSSDEMAAIFNTATLSTDRTKYVPLPGVGDQAVRKSSDGSVIAARKGKLYCSVSVAGGTDYDVPRGSAEEIGTKLGALCTKVFSAK